MPGKIRDSADLFRGLAQGLKQAARRPNIHGYQPHEKQLQFHSSNAKTRQLIGGNRSGKTVGGCAECVYYARKSSPYKRIRWDEPMRLRVVTVDLIQGLNKIVLPEVSRWVPPSMLINGSWEDSYSKQERTLTLQDGGFIEFLTYEMDLEKFAGTSRHGIWFDEEPPEDIFKECAARVVDTGGDMWMTMTPVEGMTWTFDKIYERAALDPQIDVFEVDMTDNPHISQQEIDAFVSLLDEDEIDARLHGKYVQRGGLIYPHFDKSIHVVDPFLPPSNWLHFRGMDHGLANPTSWHWYAVAPDGRVVVYDEHYEAGQLVEHHARIVHEKTVSHIDGSGQVCWPVYSVGDPSIVNRDPIQGKSVQTEYMDHGIPIMAGNNDVSAGIDKVRTMFGNYRVGLGNERRPVQLYITRDNPYLLWELSRYRWAMWEQRKVEQNKNRKEEPRKKDDHACDDLRYAIMSRPEYDSGEEIPEKANTLGAPEAVDPYDRVDEGLNSPTQWETVDSYLGSEY